MSSIQNGMLITDTLFKQKTVTSAANAGDVTLATVSGSAQIESVIVKSTGATTADLTSIGVYGGASKVVTFVSSADGARANLAAIDQQVSWEGNVELGSGKTIVMTLTGTGATAVALLVTIKYRPVSGGSLS